ncbi:hypothetical protein LY78DRAFT_100012 [Colletotrichum sublineola]|nr:hypothetical protein LY78DRAFT_100012 [Colletotrichum sublineola]
MAKAGALCRHALTPSRKDDRQCRDWARLQTSRLATRSFLKNERLMVVGLAEPPIADRQEKLFQTSRTRNGPLCGMTDLAVSPSTQMAVIRNSVAKSNRFRRFETSPITPADRMAAEPNTMVGSRSTRAGGSGDDMIHLSNVIDSGDRRCTGKDGRYVRLLGPDDMPLRAETPSNPFTACAKVSEQAKDRKKVYNENARETCCM